MIAKMIPMIIILRRDRIMSGALSATSAISPQKNRTTKYRKDRPRIETGHEE